MRRVLLVLCVLLSVGVFSSESVRAASTVRVESSSGGGSTACNVLQISELLAISTKGGGGRAFVDLSVSDTCGGTAVSTVADGTLAAGDLTSNRNRTRLRATLVDQWGTGTVVKLDVVFTCWNQAVPDIYCLATLSGKVTVNGITVTLDPWSDAAITITG